MTTYAYSITLTESELIALRAALNYYQNRCLGELTEGPCAPYWAHNEAIKDIQRKLFQNVRMTSTNNFDRTWSFPKTKKNNNT